GFAQSTSGNVSEAVANLRKAITLSPRNEYYRFNLATVYMNNRQPNEAIAILNALRGSTDPQVAARASDMVEQVQKWERIRKEDQETAAAIDREQAAEAKMSTPPPPPNAVPAKFLQGTISAVDCGSSPAASLTVTAAGKTYKMT